VTPARAPRERRPREEVSAGGIVVRRDGARTLVLLIRDPYRNWGFPKGHLEAGEAPADAAVREVGEETGLATLALKGPVDTIDWEFRFRGRRIHKVCHFFLMETADPRTRPRRAEGIRACRWASFEEAERLVSYENARGVLRLARRLVEDATPGTGTSVPLPAVPAAASPPATGA
jgi:8-oxo-dGTP pyrophosphatase MutT (NUDIX family)